MMYETRINVIIPKALYAKSQKLVKIGYFANFSELVREGLRKQLIAYEEGATVEERKLLELIRRAHEKGQLLDEKAMRKHGLRI